MGFVYWSTGRIGVKHNNMIVTLELDEENTSESSIVENPIDYFGISMPSYAINTPIDKIEIGDIIVDNSDTPKVLGWIIDKSKTGKSFELKKLNGSTVKWTPPKVHMIGVTSGVLVVKSLPGLTGEAGFGSFQQMLPMMMAGDDNENSNMMQMMMLSNAIGLNPITGQVGQKSDANNMMQMFMMMQMIGGRSNKFSGKSNFFGEI